MSTPRLDRKRALTGIAADQGGYFTAAQALAGGYTYQAHHHHVRQGNWERVSRGVFRLSDWPVGEHDDLVRWSLWAGGGAVVSHESALIAHGIGEFNPAKVHLTLARGLRRSASGVMVHRSALRRDEVEVRAGYALTTPGRSLVDVAGSGIDGDHLDRAIEEAHGAGLVTARQLREAAESVSMVAALRIEQSLGRIVT